MRIFIAFFLMLLLWSSITEAGDVLRCGSRLAKVGDNKAEVLIKCGTPDWRDGWTDNLIQNFATVLERRLSVEREQWIYNFGPHQFLRILSFANGRLADVSTGERGYIKDGRLPVSCDVQELQTGLTQFDVLQRCGQPFFMDTRDEERFESINRRKRLLVETRVDEWTYNLGPTQFMRIITFRNGRLMTIRSGDKGF